MLDGEWDQELLQGIISEGEVLQKDVSYSNEKREKEVAEFQAILGGLLPLPGSAVHEKTSGPRRGRERKELLVPERSSILSWCWEKSSRKDPSRLLRIPDTRPSSMVKSAQWGIRLWPQGVAR